MPNHSITLTVSVRDYFVHTKEKEGGNKRATNSSLTIRWEDLPVISLHFTHEAKKLSDGTNNMKEIPIYRL